MHIFSDNFSDDFLSDPRDQIETELWCKMLETLMLTFGG